MEITSKEKDCFFYMMMDDSTYFRLSLRDIFEGRKTTYRVKLPDERMIHIMLGHTAFLLGNQNFYCLDSVARVRPSSFDPQPDTYLHRISRLIHQECSTENPPILETIEGKIYVLATPPPPKKSAERMFGLVACTDKHIHSETQRRSPRFFRVFDPSNNSWKHLYYPPHLVGSYRSFRASSKKPPYVKSYCAWGHKLIVHGAGSASGTSYMYNTRLEKWVEFWIHNAMAFVEIQGFFIAVQSYPAQVVASRLDSNGIPGREFKVLHQLDYIFCPFLRLDKCFMGSCGGDLLWIVYSSDNDNDYKCYTHVAIFQVSISLDHAGDPVLSAHLKASEEYHLAMDHFHGITQSDRLYSAFAMRQYLNKDDIMEKVLSVTPCYHHHSLQGSEDFEPHFVKRRRMSSSEDHSEPHGRLGSSSWGSDSSLSSGSPPKLEILPYKIHLVEEWVVPLRSVEDINEKFKNFCLQKLTTSPWHDSFGLQVETRFTSELLGSITTKGFLTINRQAAVNGERSSWPSVGWGYVYQKARLDFFCSKEKLDALVDKCKALPSLTYVAMNREGSWISNIGQTDVNVVTWGVFPVKKMIEQTVVDYASFLLLKDKAFEIWTSGWASFYPEGDSSRKLLEKVQNSYFLVSLVDDDYLHGDLFAPFADF